MMEGGGGREGEKATPFPDPGRDPDSSAAMGLIEAISRFAELSKGRYEAMAHERIRGFGMNTAVFSGEDAVSSALTALWEALGRSGDPSHSCTIEDVKGSFELRLRDIIREEWRRQLAKKRGGNLVFIPLSAWADDSRHPAAGPILAPIERREARRAARERLTLLDRADKSLRAILRLRRRGATKAEIAASLDISVSSVKRGIDRIRSIWAHHLDESGRYRTG